MEPCCTLSGMFEGKRGLALLSKGNAGYTRVNKYRQKVAHAFLVLSFVNESPASDSFWEVLERDWRKCTGKQQLLLGLGRAIILVSLEQRA